MKKYTEPELEIVYFTVEDVITTSPGQGGGIIPDGGLDEDELPLAPVG